MLTVIGRSEGRVGAGRKVILLMKCLEEWVGQESQDNESEGDRAGHGSAALIHFKVTN